MDDRLKPQIPINSDPYPNASRKAINANEKPKTKPKQEAIVDTAKVSTKKQSAWRRAKHRIFEQEGKELKEYVVNDVLIPSIKDTISNMVSNGIDILLYGEARHLSQRRTGIFGGIRNGNYVTYNSNSTRISSPGVRSGMVSNTVVRNNLALDDFIFETRQDANDVLDHLSTILIDYGIVTVADLYNMCGKNAPYTFNNYAWKDLSTAGVSLTRDGYLLNLPTPQPLD